MRVCVINPLILLLLQILEHPLVKSSHRLFGVVPRSLYFSHLDDELIRLTESDLHLLILLGLIILAVTLGLCFVFVG